MPFRIVRVRVGDYERWKRVREENAARRREAGITSEQVFRNQDDPNELALLIEADDFEQVGRLWTRTEAFQAAMQRGGATDRVVYLPEEDVSR